MPIVTPAGPLSMRKNEKGQSILVWTSGTSQTQIANLQKPLDDAYKYVKDKIDQGYRRPSALPQSLRWMPGVINMLDDAQDILATGLNLARPLLKRASTRLWPGIGWALTANDLLNLATTVLGAATIPGLSKPDSYKRLRNIKQGIKDPGTALKQFTDKKGFGDKFSAVIQGLQATDTLFGKGLQLGQIMGGLSDGVWSLIDVAWQGIKPYDVESTEGRILAMDKSWTASGEGVKAAAVGVIKAGSKLWNDAKSLFGYKRSTIEEKAARLLLQLTQMPFIMHVLDDNDVIMIMAAQKMATGVLSEFPHVVNDDRALALTACPFPPAIPINPVSRQALIDAGLNPDDPEPAIIASAPWPTLGHAIDVALDKSWLYESGLRDRAEQNIDLWSDVYELQRESGEEVMESLTGVHPDEYTTWTPEVIAALGISEFDVSPPRSLNDSELRQWLFRSMSLSHERGYKSPSVAEWRQASSELFGSYRRKSESS